MYVYSTRLGENHSMRRVDRRTAVVPNLSTGNPHFGPAWPGLSGGAFFKSFIADFEVISVSGSNYKFNPFLTGSDSYSTSFPAPVSPTQAIDFLDDHGDLECRREQTARML